MSRSLKLVVLGLAVLAGGCDRQSADKAQPQASSGAPAGTGAAVGAIDRSHKGSALPAVTIGDAAGASLALASLSGKPVLINLWATWCAPCIAELPQLDALSAGGKVRVVTVSQDMGDGKAIAGFLKEKGAAHLPAWLDAKNDLAAAYNANTLPMSVLYDSKGKEVWRVAGPRDWASAESAGLIAEAQ